jgi:N-hydroxyarylamine O-acetyltransferase
MNIESLLARIEYAGSRRPDDQTLRAMHRAFLTAIPYEGIDVYLRRPVGLDVAAIYAKIVRSGRGGWCFEMNTLLCWALRELGFAVERLNSTVCPSGPEHYDDGGHMLLRVTIDGVSWLADAGFGNGLLEAIPLREGAHRQFFHTFGLERDDSGRRWKFTNQAHDPHGFYVFAQTPTTDDTFAPTCARYQDDPASSWRSRLNCMIYEHNGDYHELRGRVYMHVTHAGKSRAEVGSQHAFAALLRETFKLMLHDEDVELLWRKVCADHDAWLAARG